jgi:hypothetical protein
MRFTLLAALSGILILSLSACTTPTPLKSEYMLGDASFDVAQIESALTRDAVVYKPRRIKNSQNPTELGNATQVSKAATQVSVRMIPMTKPLITSRVLRDMNERAKQEKWKDTRLKNEIRNAISTDTIRYVSGKQCFDTMMVLSGAKQKSRAAVPSELEPRNWSGSVVQGRRTYGLSITQGPRCQGQGGRALSVVPYRLRFGTSKDIECKMVVCTASSINLHEPFNVEYKPRFEQNLFPVVINWPGAKDMRIAGKTQVPNRQISSR